MKLTQLVLFSRSVLAIRFALAAFGFLSTLAIANHLFTSKALASTESSCESHLKNAQGYRKWANLYQPLAGQNASYRLAFQNYEALGSAAADDFQRCKSAL